MKDESVSVEAVRIALLREEGHRERIAPYTPTAALSRVHAMWARELERQQERKLKVSPLRRQA